MPSAIKELHPFQVRKGGDEKGKRPVDVLHPFKLLEIVFTLKPNRFAMRFPGGAGMIILPGRLKDPSACGEIKVNNDRSMIDTEENNERDVNVQGLSLVTLSSKGCL